MRYMLVNVGSGSLQIDLHTPTPSYNKQNLHRPGPVVALSIPRGQSINILPYFEGSIEKAHESVKFSCDFLRLFKPSLLHTYVCDDNGRPIDIEKLFCSDIDEEMVEVDSTSYEDVTNPDMGQSAMIAAIDQHEAEAAGEANPPPFTDEGEVNSSSAVVETTEETVVEVDIEDEGDDEGEVNSSSAVVETTEETIEEDSSAIIEGGKIPPDDLTKIKGIGEAMEQKLYEAGLTTYADISEVDLNVLTEIFGSKAEDIKNQAKQLIK